MRIGFLKNTIAKLTGYFNLKGEKLVSAKLTQEKCDVFNSQGTQTPAVSPKSETNTKTSGPRRPRNRKSKGGSGTKTSVATGNNVAGKK